MKISIELDHAEQIAAIQMWLSSRSPALYGSYNFTIASDGTIVLDHSVLKASIEMWLLAQGHTVSDSDVETIGADGTVTIALTQAPVLTPTPLPPVARVPVPAAAANIPSKGHLVVVDPPLSATGNATMFGLDWNGERDKEDNQEGFFTDPSTGKEYDTGVRTLMGASLPREILMSSFGISDAWKTPFSDAHTDEVWSKNAGAVRQFAMSHNVSLTIDSGGLSQEKVPLVDAGPLGIGKNGCTIGNLVDLTYCTAWALNTHGNSVCTIELLVNGSPIELRGWDFVNKRVG